MKVVCVLFLQMYMNTEHQTTLTNSVGKNQYTTTLRTKIPNKIATSKSAVGMLQAITMGHSAR
jgi:hypothetical protein